MIKIINLILFYQIKFYNFSQQTNLQLTTIMTAETMYMMGLAIN